MKNTTSPTVLGEPDGRSVRDDPSSFRDSSERLSACAQAQQQARHSWHSCDALRDTKAKSRMSRQDAALQI